MVFQMAVLEIEKANKQELGRWLSEQPCPKCDPETGNLKGYGKNVVAPCFDCEGTCLAFPWASEVCRGKWGDGTVRQPHASDCPCKGTGRVPKDVGLEVLLVKFEIEMRPPGALTRRDWVAFLKTGKSGEGDTPLLAALRAVVGSLMP